ncbi:hypothetical protein Q8A67_006752 [Cirrhinus molitorella]|uniref:Uncharacterized protein n=1 Tax=Cirrhinus molitorella TaxID=172907 RepID=A0AA88PXW7_9TELE|nr:hypothetical protein Q8A67_006752 [Cirrhinus molitorella]
MNARLHNGKNIDCFWSGCRLQRRRCILDPVLVNDCHRIDDNITVCVMSSAASEVKSFPVIAVVAVLTTGDFCKHKLDADQFSLFIEQPVIDTVHVSFIFESTEDFITPWATGREVTLMQLKLLHPWIHTPPTHSGMLAMSRA